MEAAAALGGGRLSSCTCATRCSLLCAACRSRPGVAPQQTGFHPAENQRIDAPTAAWWLDDHSLLVQVPGGLERVPVDASGVPGPPQPVSRPPGSTIVRTDAGGAWLVRLAGDDDTFSWQRWPDGDFRKALDTEPDPPASPATLTISAGGSIDLIPSGIPLRLTPPPMAIPQSLLLSPDRTLLFTLAAGHRVFTWRLTELTAALDAEGFPSGVR